MKSHTSGQSVWDQRGDEVRKVSVKDEEWEGRNGREKEGGKKRKEGRVGGRFCKQSRRTSFWVIGTEPSATGLINDGTSAPCSPETTSTGHRCCSGSSLPSSTLTAVSR